MKRLFDLSLAVFGLILLLPLFMAIAVAIKVDSKGPIFFRQHRVGLHGRQFRIFKFRTMHIQQAEGAPEVTVEGDVRITRVGAVLRRWKLDELPQLIDVVRGTMSFVGPRPEVPRYMAHYPSAWRERLRSVRPGITDYASVQFRNENELLAHADDPEREYIDVVLPTKIQYALRYVDNASLSTDVQLIGLTLRTVFVPRMQSIWSSSSMQDSPLWPWLYQRMSASDPRRRTIATAVDALIVLGCWHITYLFRLGFERWQPGRPWYDDYVSIGIVVTYLLSLSLMGVPRGLWRFFEFDDVRRISSAALLAGLLSAVTVLLMQLAGVARAVLVLHPLFCIVGLSFVRMSYRMLWEYARRAAIGGVEEQRRAIVLGAGEAGRRVVNTLHRQDGWVILAMLDDDHDKWGLRVGPVAVVGGLGDLALPHILAGATHVILAMPSATQECQDRALQLARHTGLAVMTVPPRGAWPSETAAGTQA